MPAVRTAAIPSAPLVLGIDEAGRGSVLGPLVVGGFLAPADAIDRLSAIGVRDSKLLSPRERDRIYALLPAVGRRVSVHLAPIEVDESVRRGALNALEAEAFARLIRRTRPAEVYVDACDPVAPRFGRLVRGLSGSEVPVHSHHGADRRFPIVGAASIVAKVQRDRAIARLQRSLGFPIGSGYPSDATTVNCVRTALAGSPSRAEWIRHSWWTAERLKPLPRVVPLEAFPA